MAWTCESPNAADDAGSSRPRRLPAAAKPASVRVLTAALFAFALVLTSTGSGVAGWAVDALRPQPAFAATTASVKAQISTLQAKLAAAGAAVHQATVTYRQDAEAVQALAGQLSADRSRAAQAASSLAASEAALRHELVGAYVGGYFVSPSAPVSLNGVGVADPAVSETYISVATDTVRAVIDRYQAARAGWADAVATVSAGEKKSEQAETEAATARAAALDEAASVSKQLAVLQSQLAGLEAQAGGQAAAAPQGGPVAGGLLTAVEAQLGATPAGVTSPGSASQGAPTGTGGASLGAGAATTTLATVPSPPVGVPVESLPPPTTAAPTTDPPVTTAPPTTTPPTTLTTTAPTTDPPVAEPPSTAPPSITAAPTTAAPTTAFASSGPPTPAEWLALRTCESGDNYTENTGNGYYGAYQFSQATWTGLGYPGRPDQEPPSMQDQAAAQLQAAAGWGAWPACSAALGL